MKAQNDISVYPDNCCSATHSLDHSITTRDNKQEQKSTNQFTIYIIPDTHSFTVQQAKPYCTYSLQVFVVFTSLPPEPLYVIADKTLSEWLILILFSIDKRDG
jgi:hypothetical protein